MFNRIEAAQKSQGVGGGKIRPTTKVKQIENTD